MTQLTQRKAVQFPNLNGVRFIAALMVIIHHIEQFKGQIGLPSFYHDNTMGTNLGGLGVTLFFVLSGFLITYLLLVEKNDFNTISLKDFYLRRVLRIWPLYYLVVLLAFFVIPSFFPSLMFASSHYLLYESFYLKLMMFVFFIPNVAFITVYPIPYAAQAWSIGVEEQFYLVWPLIIKYVNKLIPALCLIVVLFIVAHAVLYRLMTAADFGSIARLLEEFLKVTRIECMAIGGISAVLLFQQARMLKFLYWKPIQFIAYCVTGVLMYHETPFPILNHIPYAVLFSIIILNLASNKETIVNIKWRMFDYLGKISYGLYMLEGIGITIATNTAIKTLRILNVFHFTLLDNLLLYAFCIIVTIAISATSYELFEKRFLKLKLRYSKIVSGDNVHQTIGEK